MNGNRPLRQIVDSHFEWLAVFPDGRTFPLQQNEIEIDAADEKLLIGIPGEKGFRNWRVLDYAFESDELLLKVTGIFGGEEKEIRVVPRASAADLSRNIELARLVRANEIAAMIEKSFAGTKLKRVSLNAENGRLAQIIIETRPGVQTAVLADVTSNSNPETMLASAFLWLDRMNERRKSPLDEIWIVGEKKQTRTLRKLHALLNNGARHRITIIEIVHNGSEPKLRICEPLKISSLWREKVKQIKLPAELRTTETAERVLDLSTERIDVIRSKQGETLRFMGLPFVRVRSILGQEKSWFGVEKKRRPLTEESWIGLAGLFDDLVAFRSVDTPNKRHELFRASPEAWLESVLRRNIKLLDANLILSPLYNQFRTSSDKIDLLALRKDGRLVIIELKTSPDREMVFQAADYWRKIELQRRRGEIARAGLFGDLEILDKPALVYTVAPALSFHRDFDYFARMLLPEIELWRFELHEDWRRKIKVIARKSYSA